MALHRATLLDLRARAERCLASAAPTPAEAHELAVVALQALVALEASAHGGGPYRGAAMADPPAADARVASLERALEHCQLRLHQALATIASLERGR